MRLVSLSSLSAVVAALMIFPPLAPPSATADESPRTTKKPIVREERIPRRWGIAGIVSRTPNSGPKDFVLPDAVVEYNTVTKRIAVIRPIDSGKGIPVAGTSSPKETVDKYLRTNHAALGLSADLAELRLVRERESSESVMLSYGQQYQGVPVIGGEGYVVAKDHAILLVSMQLIPIFGNTRIVSPADPALAIKAVIDDVNRHYPSKGDERFEPKARFGALVRDGVPSGAWEVEYTTTDDGYRAVVDAATNEVLSVASVMIAN